MAFLDTLREKVVSRLAIIYQGLTPLIPAQVIYQGLTPLIPAQVIYQWLTPLIDGGTSLCCPVQRWCPSFLDGRYLAGNG
jgi:hypothetical protein